MKFNLNAGALVIGPGVVDQITRVVVENVLLADGSVEKVEPHS